MVNAALRFSNEIEPSDPNDTSVLIVGQKCHLDSLTYEYVFPKFGARVSKEMYEEGMDLVKSCTYESVPLFLKYVYIARLPTQCSRYNTPSRAHALTKLVKNLLGGRSASIVIACEYKDVLASACAIARSFPQYSRKHFESECNITVNFVGMNLDGTRVQLTDDDLDCLTCAAYGVRLAAKIVDMPCSEMHTDIFLQAINSVGSLLNITPEVIRGDELAKQGFGGLYSVGRAAEHPPSLAVLSHKVPGAKETYAWVGKGIVYDTGGLCIKSRTSMPGMKRDCAGAAGILGAFYLAVKMGFKENLHAVFCLAENAVGPRATRPDDVIKMFSGKTVEITNTDAEGRLVLGDGVAYAKKCLGANVIVDMATLTGAQGTACGRFHAALLSNCEYWEKKTVKASRLSGDLVHPVIYAPEFHRSEFSSTVADMKNSVSDTGNCPVACAGIFIGLHIDFEPDWIHIDMAKPASSADRATGYGVSLLPTLFGSASSNRLLRQLGELGKEHETQCLHDNRMGNFMTADEEDL